MSNALESTRHRPVEEVAVQNRLEVAVQDRVARFVAGCLAAFVDTLAR